MIETPAQSGGRQLQVGDECVGVCVSWLKGYGFVKVVGVERDVFTPSRNLLDSTYLEPGDQVSFVVRMDKLGRLMADNVETRS